MNYSLYLFWKIGKVVFDNYKVSCNVIEKCSTFLSYYFGNSSKFNNDNIKYMIRFYSDFPVFYKELNKISWEQYKLILDLKNRKERYFYFYISILFDSNLLETNEFIENDYYYRLLK